MLTESERLKTLRKTLNMRQGDFSKKISTTQGHISDIENGRKHLSERTIKLICLEAWDGKVVNEQWLRSGTGEMFLEIPKEDEYFKAATLISKNKDERAINAVIQYWKLDQASKDAIWDFIDKLSSSKDS